MTDLLERPSTEPAPNAPSRRARRAWLIPGAILALASLGWGTLNVLGLVAHGQYSTTSTFETGDVSSLQIDNDTGTITVIGTDVRTAGDAIVITAKVSDGWRSTDVSSEVVDGVLRVHGDCPFLGSPWCNVEVTVSLPSDRPVLARASNGSIRIRGVAAPLDVSVGNGSIDLDDVGAPMELSSDNGRITGRRLTSAAVVASTDNGAVELSFLDPPRSVVARSSNGRIELVLPDDVAYRVDARSDNGSVDTVVRTDPASEHVIDARSDNGSVTVRLPG